jgi:hypothetical protein
MGIRIISKSNSPVAKEAAKISSLISSFMFERDGDINSSEMDALSKANKALSSIINRSK